MPRNGAGTFGVVNPIVVGALRSSSAVNANFTDAGDEITNSLAVDGQASMTGSLKATDGTLINPGIVFAEDTNLGFRRSAPDEVQWVSGGTAKATMDASGKLSLGAGLEVSGPMTHSSGGFGPQILTGTGASRVVARRTENDTNEHEIASYESGSGSGAKGSLRIVGGGSNNVATMRFYVNNILAFQWTGVLFTHTVDAQFGSDGIKADTDGFLDFPEIVSPSAPTSNAVRIYAKDDGINTDLYYRTSSEAEAPLRGGVDQQTFTTSGVWAKSAGRAMALIEVWGGGASGTKNGGFGGGGGGGGGYSSRMIAITSLSSFVSITIGAGGGITTASTGNGFPGGQTSFGSYLTAFGGGTGLRALATAPATGAGGAGGGQLSAGTGDGGAGGGPNGIVLGKIYGGTNNSNPFGGAGTFSDLGLRGGGGGGRGGDEVVGGPGGPSFWGGAGGGGASDTGSATVGGISLFGGNGGAENRSGGAFPASDGHVPGGGGGASMGSAPNGTGGSGQIRITCW